MLKMSKTPRKITIFEGPDGSGKTTTAKEFAEKTGALYVHFEAYYGVKDIYKFFIEAMSPALLGYQDVVLDRCWHSGPIYDVIFRNLLEHEQRQTPVICNLLDRAAAQCEAILVHCYPDEDTCIDNWKSRLDTELVKSELKMRCIHKMYSDIRHTVNLLVLHFDYTQDCSVSNLIEAVKSERQCVYAQSAETPRVHIVVSSGAKTNADVMIDIPGVRFEPTSNEYKLAQAFVYPVLESEESGDTIVPEELVKFLDVDTDFISYFQRSNHHYNSQIVIAMGDDAIAALKDLNTKSVISADMCNVQVVNLLDFEGDDLFRQRTCTQSLAHDVIAMLSDIVDSEDEVPPSRPSGVHGVGTTSGDCSAAPGENTKAKIDKKENVESSQSVGGSTRAAKVVINKRDNDEGFDVEVEINAGMIPEVMSTEFITKLSEVFNGR